MKVFSKLLKRLKINNSGSAIVVVIMAMGFVAVLGVTVMWMSLSNFRMKATDMKNKQSFYTAEAIYDQIKVGLQYDASVAAGQAYTATLQSYSYDSWNEDERAAYFKKQYISNLILCLKNPSNDQEYDLNHLLSYVDADVHLSVNPAAKGNPIRFLYYSGTPTLLDSGKDYLLLKNLKLEYTDDDGFYSVIDTDIMISAPEVPFNSASKSIDLLFYALIANIGIEVGNPASLTVDGSIYAGDNGINLCKPITVNGALNVISKGPINIENNNAVFKITDLSSPLANTLDGRKLDTKGGLLTKLFAKDINVTDGTFSVAADSYIADDLTISGQNSEVEFDHGTYTGYGYSLNEGTSTLSSNNSSSAIIVNGLQSNIDMSTLTQLTLGGSAFVGTSRAGSYDIDHTGEFATTMANNAPVSNNDIPTGESISIKGDQLAYLVPGECIGVKDGKSIYSKNPLTLQEYEQMIGEISYRDANNNLIIKDRCSLIDINVDVRSYGAGKRLSAYISDDYTKNTKWIFAPSNGQTLVYLYLQFNSRDQANKFFSDYYNVNTDRMNAYFDVYVKNNVILPSDVNSIKLAGNGVVGTRANKELKDATDSKLIDTDQFDAYAYQNEALCTTLTMDYYSLTDEQKSKSVFENIVDVDTFSKEVTGTFVIESDESKAIFTDANNAIDNIHVAKNLGTTTAHGYEWTGDGADPKATRILVAENDVVLSADYTGIIICGGTVYVNGSNIKVRSIKNATAEIEAQLNKLLQAEETSNDPFDADGKIHPIDFFDSDVAAKAIGQSIGTTYSGTADFTELVNFQSWYKE